MAKMIDKVNVKVECDVDEAIQKANTLISLVKQLKELGISKRNLNRIMKHINIKEIKSNDTLD